MGCYVRGDKNSMGCYVRGDKTAWDVLSGVANLCGMFCPGYQKMAWDVLSRDVLSGSRKNGMGCFVQGDKNSMGCYVRGNKTAWDVMSRVANLCGMFCTGWQ